MLDRGQRVRAFCFLQCVSVLRDKDVIGMQTIRVSCNIIRRDKSVMLNSERHNRAHVYIFIITYRHLLTQGAGIFT